MENNKPKKRKKSLYRTRELHLMLFPAVIFTALFCYLPIGGLIMAFQDFKPLLGFQKSAFVGLKQFHYIFTMPSFRQAFVNTIIIAFFKITLSILVPLVLSLMLNEVTKSWFKRSVQTIVFIPYFFSWAILAGMVLEIFAYDGVINNVLESLFGMEPIAFLVSNKYFRTIVIGSDVWKGMGYNTVLLLAAITNVDPTLHEAAQVDGATDFQTFWRIKWPQIMPTTLYILIITTINSFQCFALIDLLTSGGPNDSTLTLMYYIYHNAVKLNNFGYGCALGIILAIIIAIFSALQFRLAKE